MVSALHTELHTELHVLLNGGAGNLASGDYAFIAGGLGNKATAAHAFAAGRDAYAEGAYTVYVLRTASPL